MTRLTLPTMTLHGLRSCISSPEVSKAGCRHDCYKIYLHIFQFHFISTVALSQPYDSNSRLLFRFISLFFGGSTQEGWNIRYLRLQPVLQLRRNIPITYIYKTLTIAQALFMIWDFLGHSLSAVAATCGKHPRSEYPLHCNWLLPISNQVQIWHTNFKKNSFKIWVIWHQKAGKKGILLNFHSKI